jgi:hypothetical protein
MSKLVDCTVFRFLNGKTVETFERDEDFESGLITHKVANKVRIMWDGNDNYEYVDITRLVRIDRETYDLRAPDYTDLSDEDMMNVHLDAMTAKKAEGILDGA